MSRVFLMLAVLCVQSAVTSGRDEEDDCLPCAPCPEPVCKCHCHVNATSLPLPPCPPPTAAAPPPAPAPAPAPAPGFALLPRALYKFVGCEGALPWRAANETCARDGAHLAVPDSMPEVYMLLGFLLRAESDCSVFIGLHANGSDGRIQTVLGEPMPDLLKKVWEKQEDREVNDHHRCLTFSREGDIEAENCDADLAYACKLKLK